MKRAWTNASNARMPLRASADTGDRIKRYSQAHIHKHTCTSNARNCSSFHSASLQLPLIIGPPLALGRAQRLAQPIGLRAPPQLGQSARQSAGGNLAVQALQVLLAPIVERQRGVGCEPHALGGNQRAAREHGRRSAPHLRCSYSNLVGLRESRDRASSPDLLQHTRQRMKVALMRRADRVNAESNALGFDVDDHRNALQPTLQLGLASGSVGNVPRVRRVRDGERHA